MVVTSEQHKENVDPAEVPLQEKQNIDEEITPKTKKKTIFEKLCYIKSNITVEPIFAGMVIPSTLSRLAIQNLNLDKACRVKLKLGDYICDALIDRRDTANMTAYERDVQRVVSSIEAWKSIIQTAIPIVLVVLMGAWSDRTGKRKLCILLPIIGEFLVSLSNILSTFFFFEIPVEATMFLEAIFPAITGGWVMVYLGVFSYISDITSAEDRTFRIGIVNLCLTAGVPIGISLSGILLKLLGYYGIFIISASVYLLTLYYGCVYLHDRTKTDETKNEKTKSVRLTDFIPLLKETAQVAFKKRKNNNRIKIILIFVVVAIIYGPNHGEKNVNYLYVRYKLMWDAVKYSMYSTYSTIIHTLSALFCISYLSRHLGFHDSILCLISVVSKCAGSFYLPFVHNDWNMFMVPIIELLNATTFTSLRSMASKLVTSEEMGKVNSLFSLVETLGSLVFDPIYMALYFVTLPVLPGAVYFFSAGMTLPAISVLIWFFLQHKKETRKMAAIQQQSNENEVVPMDCNKTDK